MRTTLLLLALALTACGAPKTPKNDSMLAPGSAASDKANAPAKCCCALASDPVQYEMQDKLTCETDTHGTCAEDAKCVP
ncbi:MAG: hypothetical protein KF773_05300 [Deltaproteobacteria bacterium]|nr:hypothetical protein [Deltaproteobacteria bacterium]MCW5800982.1 hypothetical protein [Deltaproteobacteria bacterium]